MARVSVAGKVLSVHGRGLADLKNVPGKRKSGNFYLVHPTFVNLYHLSNVIPRQDWTDKAVKIAEECSWDEQARYRAKLEEPRGYMAEGRLTAAQEQGAEWLAMSDSAILADDMGTGKTVQTCAALEEIDAKHVLVVCPLSVIPSWEKHIAEWTNLKSAVAGRDQLNDDTNVWIVNWESLKTYSRVSGYGSMKLTAEEKRDKLFNGYRFDVIIADEAHRAKNHKAKQTRALWSLKAQQRWALTGTPIANNPGDIWSLLRWVSPHDWPSRNAFINRYCDTTYNPFTEGWDIAGFNNHHREEFQFFLDMVMLRRGRDEMIERSIAKSYETAYACLDDAHRATYESVREGYFTQLQDGRLLEPINPMVTAMRLLQLSAANLDYGDSGGIVMSLPSPKVERLLEVLDYVGDSPVVVMSSSKQLLMLACQALTEPFVVVTGDSPKAERQMMYDSFSRGEVRILMTTTGVSSEGVDLSAADTLIFLQRNWSLIEAKQAEDRIARFSQKADRVRIIDIVTKDTIDERVREMLKTKERGLKDLTRSELLEVI